MVCVSWNNESNRLLVGLSTGSIQIWSYNPHTFDINKSQNPQQLDKEQPVKFSIYEEHETIVEEDLNENGRDSIGQNKTRNDLEELIGDNLFSSTNIFKKLWETRLANAVQNLKYSPDSTLFASFSENDRLVKIWHEIRPRKDFSSKLINSFVRIYFY